jgi:hypothetical protein
VQKDLTASTAKQVTRLTYALHLWGYLAPGVGARTPPFLYLGFYAFESPSDPYGGGKKPHLQGNDANPYFPIIQ